MRNNDINLNELSNNELKTLFIKIMDEYTKRLCDLFECNYEDCYWIADDRTGTFFINHLFISMADVITIVNYNVSYKEFIEWYDYNQGIHYAKLNHPNDLDKKRYFFINLMSWIKGCPRRVTKEELHEEEVLYWKNLNKNE